MKLPHTFALATALMAGFAALASPARAQAMPQDPQRREAYIDGYCRMRADAQGGNWHAHGLISSLMMQNYAAQREAQIYNACVQMMRNSQ